MNFWSTRSKDSGTDPGDGDILRRLGRQQDASVARTFEAGQEGSEAAKPENRPIEPEGRSLFGGGTLKWVLFLAFVLYALFSRYHEPLLQKMGSYLVVADGPQRVQLLVITLGDPLPRTLTAAEWYREGRAEAVFVGRASLPEGADELRRRGIQFREERDRVLRWLEALEVPLSACLLQDDYLGGLKEEAAMVKRIALENGYRQVALATAPLESRRTLAAYEKVLGGTDIELYVVPSTYSSYEPAAWWQSPRWRQAVLTEYVRLMLAWFDASP